MTVISQSSRRGPLVKQSWGGHFTVQKSLASRPAARLRDAAGLTFTTPDIISVDTVQMEANSSTDALNNLAAIHSSLQSFFAVSENDYYWDQIIPAVGSRFSENLVRNIDGSNPAVGVLITDVDNDLWSLNDSAAPTEFFRLVLGASQGGTFYNVLMKAIFRNYGTYWMVQSVEFETAAGQWVSSGGFNNPKVYSGTIPVANTSTATPYLLPVALENRGRTR